MENSGLQLLSCLRAFCAGQPAEIAGDLDWQELYRLSGIHKLQPVVYDTLSQNHTFCGGDGELAAQWKRVALLQVAAQIGRTQKLLEVTKALDAEKISYVVVKGAVCRALYPKPDLRPSGDEDLLIPAGEAARCRAVLTRLGFAAGSTEEENTVEHWKEPVSGLHIELHSALFGAGWPEGKVLDAFFAEALERRVSTAVEQGEVMTFAPTDHFLLLITHALKHFITGGFGLRTLCDILQFARQYDGQIQKPTVYGLLEKINGRVFFEQLLYIGNEWLGFDDSGWEKKSPADPLVMLEDMIDAGIYGQSSLDRKHGGAMALQALREGKHKASLSQTLFPPAAQLARRYLWLRKAPWLLPAAWLHRLGAYALDVIRSRGKHNSPREAVSSGKQRTEMMVRYGILPQAKTEDR